MEDILLADADPSTHDLLAPVLHKAGYQLRLALNGKQALRLRQEFLPALILLDWSLPDMVGLEACRQLRNTCTTPIILLTKRSEKTAPLRGLETCADGSLIKPFSAREALAHIHAVLRRVALDKQGLPENSVHVGRFALEYNARRVLKDQRELQLSTREFDLFTALVESAGQALSRAELMARVWGSQWFGDPHTLDVHIRWLRLKIEDDPAHPKTIRTVHGFGYRFAGLDD